jgi:hypothetical protein
MSAGFQILVHRNDENAHFKLIGTFDDKAVVQLIDSLMAHSRGVTNIFIHTDSIEGIDGYNEQYLINNLNNSASVLKAKILPTGRFSTIFTSIKGSSFWPS